MKKTRVKRWSKARITTHSIGASLSAFRSRALVGNSAP